MMLATVSAKRRLFSQQPLEEGQFVQAKITAADTYDLNDRGIIRFGNKVGNKFHNEVLLK